ncbi:DNA translocase FtsK [Thermosyntropha sp.]|uniref:FtsK/SpoIIIE family DNA translocase n=1 Tax=Thermosyntropha sp. TaxID=2740820 RepID=UPI0025E8AC7E|nr:DNA translocase FtsK [Thermosyntropha sp.]MBO8158552.1 DNA translocase FtsK 4TM domain-containing protein [Thermosyntropha sp.]
MVAKNKAKSKQEKKNKLKTADYSKKNSYLDKINNEIFSVLIFMLSVFVYICLNKAKGLPEDTQVIGIIGTYLAKGLEKAFGEGAVLTSFYLLAWSIHMGVFQKKWSVRMWGISLIFISLLIGIAVYDIPIGLDPLDAGARGMGGGYAGGALAYLFLKLVGRMGIVIFLVVGLLSGLIMVINRPLAVIIKTLKDICKKVKDKIEPLLFEEVEETEFKKTGKKNKVAVKDKKSEPVVVEQIDKKKEDEEDEKNFNQSVKILSPLETKKEVTDTVPLNEEVGNTKETDVAVQEECHGENSYQKPPLSLLSDIVQERTIDKKNIKNSIAVLEETFANFGIKVKVNQVSCGPTVTRYEVTPAPGVKVSKILGLTDDLQLNLAAPGIRIEAPIPGKSAIGIEVPNNKILRVGLKSLLLSHDFKKLNSPLAFALGEDVAGNTMIARLDDMPHLLIAGSTGSGKSVCLNCIIMSFLYNASPDELKLVFIDPKMVELTIYNGIPHLLTPVVTDPKKAALILRWMVTEMEKRYRLFAEYGARDINRYNQIAENKLPFIVIIIDELADLMMVSPVEVEDAICRLAQMARAAGMHLIVATQRPSVDVVTGVIKANIPSRIAFAVSSQADSRTILDCSGAEKLLGKGDMLFLPIGANKPMRVQGAYVSDRDIEKTVDFIKKYNQFEDSAEELQELEFSLLDETESYDDELFWDAVKIFVETKKASVSLLQRKLRIGYSRAARLVDIMEERGIVSEPDNNKRREVLIDSEQFNELVARSSKHKIG